MDDFFKIIKNNEPAADADDVRYIPPTATSSTAKAKDIAVNEFKEKEQAPVERVDVSRPSTILVDMLEENESELTAPFGATALSKPNPADDLRFIPPTATPSITKPKEIVINEFKETEQAPVERMDMSRSATIIVDTTGEKESDKESYNFSFFTEMIKDDDQPGPTQEITYTDFEQVLEENSDITDFLS